MLLQFCMQGVELAFNKSEEKEFLKLTAVKQHERRSSVRELTFTDCISSCTKFTMPQRCHHFYFSIAEVALLRDYHAL